MYSFRIITLVSLDPEIIWPQTHELKFQIITIMNCQAVLTVSIPDEKPNTITEIICIAHSIAPLLLVHNTML